MSTTRGDRRHQRYLTRSAPVSRCSASRWTILGLATTSAACSVASSVRDIVRGQVLCKPGSVTRTLSSWVEVYILTKDEGGRHTPFFDGYRPQFYFRTTDVTGVAHLPGASRWLCLATTLGLLVTSSTRSPWRRASASLSARVATVSSGACDQDRQITLFEEPFDYWLAFVEVGSAIELHST